MALNRRHLAPLAALKIFDDRVDPMIIRARALLIQSSTESGSQPNPNNSNT
jgi:hypothetical protein